MRLEFIPFGPVQQPRMFGEANRLPSKSVVLQGCLSTRCSKMEFSVTVKDVLELLVVLARGIWFRRNKLVLEGTFSHPDDIFSAALKLHSGIQGELGKGQAIGAT
jgi:hypothetical protein